MHYDDARTLLSLACTVLCLACVDGGSTAARVEAVDVPTGPGTGEPFLSTTEDAVVLSWLAAEGEDHVLRGAVLTAAGWASPFDVARGGDFFVNWADFPSVVAHPDGSLWAHWLQNEADARMAYGIRLRRSEDGGATWSEPWTPHEDGTATEHGFVSLFPLADGVGVAWLDGRGYAVPPDGTEPPREMSVRFRTANADGPTGPDIAVDGRSCDCCQTDVAITSRGPVLVYRDRSPDEVRDIHVTRWEGGAWQEPRAVHADGWVIAGCPVNGPAVAALERTVAVAWFTAPGDAPEVRLAWSDDAGDTFSDPVRIDGGDPAGRVDVTLASDGSALVSWLERTGGEGAEVRVRRVSRNGPVGEPVVVSSSSSARSSGFPRMALPSWDRDAVLLAWTDIAAPGGARVRMARVEVP